MGIAMLFNYEGRIWNRQGTSIENVKTTHEYGIGIKILSLDIYIYIYFFWGVCTLPKVRVW